MGGSRRASRVFRMLVCRSTVEVEVPNLLCCVRQTTQQLQLLRPQKQQVRWPPLFWENAPEELLMRKV
jgi:hypothetical protein